MQLCLRGEISWSPDWGIVCWLKKYWKWKLFNSQPSGVNHCVHSSDVGCPVGNLFYESSRQIVSTRAKIMIKVKLKKVFNAIKMQTLSCGLFLNCFPAFMWVLPRLLQTPNAPPAYEKISSGPLPPPYSPWSAIGEHRTWKNKKQNNNS